MRQLKEKLEEREKEIDRITDAERARASAANLERKEWEDMRNRLESRIAEYEEKNEALQRDIDRLRDEHANEMRRLREQLEDARQSMSNMSAVSADPELRRENEELRMSLKEQQQITEEVRREAQEFLREMKMLSQQTGSKWERQAEMEKTIEQLEQEVRDWRNRYARTKTQLRNMRASSLGLSIEQDAGKYVREKGFTEENGLVKDVHVTKFQISIDELLQKARRDDPEKVLDAMKTVVVAVRRITKDIDDSAMRDPELQQQQAKLKSRVSNTANSLITASKNFAASAGLSPVSLIDAAAGNLVSAVVELLRTVKIRATPAGELEDDDDGTITPVDSTGFFSPSNSIQEPPRGLGMGSDSRMGNDRNGNSGNDTLPPPPPFQGLSGNRNSGDSSAYSPVSSPRESMEPPYGRRPMSRGGARSVSRDAGRPLSRNGGRPMSRNGGMMNGGGGGYLGLNKNLPAAPGGGYGMRRQDNRAEDLKVS